MLLKFICTQSIVFFFCMLNWPYLVCDNIKTDVNAGYLKNCDFIKFNIRSILLLYRFLNYVIHTFVI